MFRARGLVVILCPRWTHLQMTGSISTLMIVTRTSLTPLPMNGIPFSVQFSRAILVFYRTLLMAEQTTQMWKPTCLMLVTVATNACMTGMNWVSIIVSVLHCLKNRRAPLMHLPPNRCELGWSNSPGLVMQLT